MMFLLGFRLRAYEYVYRHRKALCDYFTPVESIRKEIDVVEQEGRQSADVLVGVHIRQGDYADFEGGRFYHSQELYAAKMAKVEQLLAPRKVTFLTVAEGEIDEAQFKGLNTVKGPGSAIGDMYSLARCDYIMGVHSTFSRWAAFYGDVPHYVMWDVAEEPTLEKFKVEADPMGYPPIHLRGVSHQ